MSSTQDRSGLSLVQDDRNRPKAMDGSVVLRPKRVISDEELEKAEKELRETAKSLYKQIEHSYWDLGRCLYDIYDGVPGGYRDLLRGDGSRTARKALFEKWGFTTFAEYCEKEIGVLRRSAQNLRQAYWWFEIHLILPEEIKKRIRTLGRSKVYVLSAFVGQDNIMMWLEKAEKLTHDELKAQVRAAKAVSAAKDGEAGNNEDPGEDVEGMPVVEQVHQVGLGLYEEQFKTYQQALDRAKQLSKSEKTSHNVELICQDFLANNDFSANPGVSLDAYLAKIERHHNVKLIAIDPVKGTPVFGAGLLIGLVRERLVHEKSEGQITGEEPGVSVRPKAVSKTENPTAG